MVAAMIAMVAAVAQLGSEPDLVSGRRTRTFPLSIEDQTTTCSQGLGAQITLQLELSGSFSATLGCRG